MAKRTVEIIAPDEKKAIRQAYIQHNITPKHIHKIETPFPLLKGWKVFKITVGRPINDSFTNMDDEPESLFEKMMKATVGNYEEIGRIGKTRYKRIAK